VWIERISLKNYRQYEEAEIEFCRPTGGRNITVILGDTGSGKTNLVNAITWCLYGNEKHLTARNKGLDIYNTLAAKNLKPGETFQVQVKIHLGESDGGRIIVTRSLKYKVEFDGRVVRIPDHLSKAEDQSTLEMMRMIGKDMKEVQDPEFIIQKLIPEQIEEYFFFDGERLDEYFKEKSGVKIAEAVFKISQLELIERVIKHLKDLKQFFVRDRNDLSPRIEEIRDLIDRLTATLTDLNDRKEKAEAQRDEAERLELEAREKLREAPVQNIGKLEDERAELEENIEKTRKEIEELKNEKIQYLCSIAPAILASSCIQKASKLIGESEASGIIPPEYQPGFVNKLLTTGRCICGRDLIKGSSEYEEVKGLLNKSSILASLTRILIEDAGRLENLRQMVQEFPDKITRMNSRIQNLERNIETMEKRKLTIDSQIASCDSEKIRQYENEVQEYLKKKEKLIEEIGQLKQQIQATQSKIAMEEKELEKELKKQTKYKELVACLEFCQELLDVASGVKEKTMEDVRKEIEQQTKELFFGMIWKERTYANIEIDEHYNVSVKHISGNEAIGTLSAGERQILALAFVSALNNVSGFDVPIVIDTPLGRISSGPREKIARSLPSCFSDRQVILLMTNEEYTSEVKKVLSEHLSKEFSIEFTECADGSKARVIENDREWERKGASYS